MKRTDALRGSSTLIVLIALVVVISIAFGGYYAAQVRKHNAVERPASVVQSPQKRIVDNTRGNVPAKADPSEGGKYLAIKEWNERIPIPVEWRGDVEYRINQNVDLAYIAADSPAYGDQVLLGSKELSALSAQCAFREDPDSPGRYGGGSLSINRTKKELSPYKYDVYLNGYWHQFLHGNGGLCYSDDRGTLEGNFQQAMLTAARSIVATP
jgi:hypothetical protein